MFDTTTMVVHANPHWKRFFFAYICMAASKIAFPVWTGSFFHDDDHFDIVNIGIFDTKFIVALFKNKVSTSARSSMYHAMYRGISFNNI